MFARCYAPARYMLSVPCCSFPPFVTACCVRQLAYSLTPRYLCSGQAFVSVVEQQAQQGRQYAEDYVKRLEIQRRYLQDTWS